MPTVAQMTTSSEMRMPISLTRKGCRVIQPLNFAGQPA
jgi:hypothetical protein